MFALYCTKNQIIEKHYLNKIIPQQQRQPSTELANSDEMKTVVLTNYVLSHFNEYCRIMNRIYNCVFI